MKRQIPFAMVFLFGIFMVFQYFVPHESSEWVYEFLLDWIYIIGIFALALGIWSLFRVSVERIKQHREGSQYSYVTLGSLFAMMAFGFTQATTEGQDLTYSYFIWLLVSLFCLVSIMRARAATDSGQTRLWSFIALGALLVAVLVAVFDDTWAFYFYTAEGLENSMFRIFFDHVMMPILATMFALLAFFIASAAYRAFRARNVLASLLLVAALIVMMRFNPWLQSSDVPWLARISTWLMNVPNMAAQRAIIIGVGLGMVGTALKVILGIERGYMGRG
jgi:hypothetical protein